MNGLNYSPLFHLRQIFSYYTYFAFIMYLTSLYVREITIALLLIL